MKTFVAMAVAMLVAGFALTAHADGGLAAPTGRVVLTISGNVANPNQDKAAAFDLAMLKAMPQTTVATKTPWTGKEAATFVGPLLRDVLAAAGATGTKATAIALNDYKSSLPVADTASMTVIVALTQDGKPMSVRDKGPLWIIYPLSELNAVDDPAFHAKMAWQLKELVIE